MNTRNLLVLPDDLPVPEDDGACAHLEGMNMPTIALVGTSGAKISLGLEGGISVVYFYPMTGRPGAPPMVGWNEIPGARGCTPQSCSFRDHHFDLLNLGIKVYGVSSQSSEDQKEAVQRLHLPFELLSDSRFELATALRLPTFKYNSLRLIKSLLKTVQYAKCSIQFFLQTKMRPMSSLGFRTTMPNTAFHPTHYSGLRPLPWSGEFER